MSDALQPRAVGEAHFPLLDGSHWPQGKRTARHHPFVDLNRAARARLREEAPGVYLSGLKPGAFRARGDSELMENSGQVLSG
jgi:hypothetical protein